MSPSYHWLPVKTPNLTLFWDLPWIDVDRAQLELLHDGAKRGHATRDMLRLVGERLEEALLVLLAVQPDDERLRRGGRHSSPHLHLRVTQDRNRIRTAHLSAWRTRIPVMRWVGMSDVSMSTVKIWDVMDTRPPLLYRSCLCTWNENVRFRAPRTARKSWHSPVLPPSLKRDDAEPGIPTPQDPELLADGRLLFWGCIDEEYEVVRRVVDLE